MRNCTDHDILNNLIGTDMWVKIRDAECGFDEYYIQVLEQTVRGYYCTIVDAYFVENYDEDAYVDVYVSVGGADRNSYELLLSNEIIDSDAIELITPVDYMSDAEIMESIGRYDAVDVDAYFEGD